MHMFKCVIPPALSCSYPLMSIQLAVHKKKKNHAVFDWNYWQKNPIYLYNNSNFVKYIVSAITTQKASPIIINTPVWSANSWWSRHTVLHAPRTKTIFKPLTQLLVWRQNLRIHCNMTFGKSQTHTRSWKLSQTQYWRN